MKKQTLAACIIAAIALSMYSCDWFGKKEKKAQASLIGKWQITGLSDSTKQPKNDFLPLLAAAKDSSKMFATFTVDSSLYMLYSTKQVPETTKYYIDTAMQKLYIKNDSAYKTFAIETLNDSLLRISADSVYIQFKKQP